MNSSLQIASASLRRTGGDVVLITIAFLDPTLEGSGSCKREASRVCGVNVRPAGPKACSELDSEPQSQPCLSFSLAIKQNVAGPKRQ